MPDLLTVYLSSEGIDRTHYFGESVVVGFQHYIVEASLVSGGFQVNSTNSHDTIVAYLERVIFFPGAHHTRIKITSRLLFKRTLTPGLFNFCMIITSTSLKHLTQQQTFCVLSLDPEQTTPHPPQHPIHTPKPNTPPPYSPSHRTHTVPSVNSLSDIYICPTLPSDTCLPGGRAGTEKLTLSPRYTGSLKTKTTITDGDFSKYATVGGGWLTGCRPRWKRQSLSSEPMCSKLSNSHPI